MKKYLLSFLLLMTITQSYSTVAFSYNDPQANYVFVTLPGTELSIILADYILLKSSEVKKLTGHRLTWKETIIFKITQRKIKKAIRKDGTVDLLALREKSKEPFKWHWGGFFLGLLLPVMGLIIAAFIRDGHRKNRTNSAAIGTLLIAIIFLAFFLVSVSG